MSISGITKKILPTLKKYPIAKAGLFGSVVREEGGLGSDIDILVEFSTSASLSLFDIAGIKIELEQTLGKKVDLVQYKNVKPLLKPYIIPSEVRIYEKNS
jgi:uncharacterized protein